MSKQMYRMTPNQRAVFKIMLSGETYGNRQLQSLVGVSKITIIRVIKNMLNNGWVVRIVTGNSRKDGDLYGYRITRLGRERWRDYQQELTDSSSINLAKKCNVSNVLEFFNRRGLLQNTAYMRGLYERQTN